MPRASGRSAGATSSCGCFPYGGSCLRRCTVCRSSGRSRIRVRRTPSGKESRRSRNTGPTGSVRRPVRPPVRRAEPRTRHRPTSRRIVQRAFSRRAGFAQGSIRRASCKFLEEPRGPARRESNRTILPSVAARRPVKKRSMRKGAIKSIAPFLLYRYHTFFVSSIITLYSNFLYILIYHSGYYTYKTILDFQYWQLFRLFYSKLLYLVLRTNHTVSKHFVHKV